MKWTRLKWSDELRHRLDRTFDDRDGFDAAHCLQENIESGRYDAFLIEGPQTKIWLVSHTWDQSCFVLSVQGWGLKHMVAEFIRVMRANGVTLVVFDTEHKGLVRILCNALDLEHIDGERFAFEVTDNENEQQVGSDYIQQHRSDIAQSEHRRH